MCSIGLYTATDQPVTAIRAAADRLSGVDLLVRSGAALDGPEAVSEFVDRLARCDVAVFWLHGSESRLPDFESVRERLVERGVPVVVARSGTATGDTDSTVEPGVQSTVRAYLDRGGVLNMENLIRYLADEFDAADWPHDEPVDLPSTGVYHPDHPGATVEDLRETFDPDRPTVGIWFYESHWTFENTRYVDSLVRALQSEGVNAFPVFTNPTGERDARWVAEHWFSDESGAVVDAVLTTFMYSLTMDERGRSASEPADPTTGFLAAMDVPVVQAMVSMRSRAAYRADDAGLPPFELALSVALPELDGVVVSHPISGKERAAGTWDGAADGTAPLLHQPLEDRVGHAARLVSNWARLGRKPPSDKQVAVVLHNYPPSDDGIGTAFGLDTPASLDRLLDQLADRGYRITDRPPDGQRIVEQLVEQLTRDARWTDPEQPESGLARVEPSTYREWFTDLDSELEAAIREEWGPPPTAPIDIPGVDLGSVVVTVQPPRGFEADPEKVYHDSALQPPHEYVAAYGWLREQFDADAVVHLGTHGSLEWLPGKTVGLDGASAPDGLLDGLPNVYPYIVNNPGEGTQATRRSYATIVDHLTPPMDTAGVHEDLADLETMVREYRDRSRDGANDADLTGLATRIREQAQAQDLGPDLGIDDMQNVETDRLVRELHAYLTDVKTSQIRMGLHTLGEPPAGERLVAYLVALTRFANPGAPSLRESVAGAMGIDAERMIEEPATYDPALGSFYAEAAETVSARSLELVGALAERDFEVTRGEIEALSADLPVLGEKRDPEAVADLQAVLWYIADELVPRIEAAEDELANTAAALAGQYVPPGGSGAPTRGNADLLPTGRNFYTLDPRRVPSKAAWQVGQSVAEGVLDRHLDEEGAYPEEVGVVAWGTPTVRTRGETIAQILALLGVEPVWTDAGRVEAVEPVPLDDLGRPRIDVTTRISGLFRDAFPSVAGLVQEAVETVASLDEPPAKNFVRKHALEAGEETAGGAGHLDLKRVFTTRPGGYGSGTNKAITTGEWADESDLADVFVNWGGYAVDGDGEVKAAHDALEERLERIEATVKLEDTAEQDEFDSSDWYAFHGGLKRAVADRSGSEPASYVGDASDPDRPQIYTNEEKLRQTMRTRVLNPDWIDSMEAHDYKGAGDLATTVEITLGWAATTDAVSDTLWEQVADAYAFDEDRQEWFMDENPWALEHVTETLLEAIDRDLWAADQETIDRLRDLQLSVDGELEADPEVAR
ncbi:cobaltochelatase subunit CobN [Halodesulfurarchaeum sp. HSR-GB]|uniref:cobaltochelatase subunit CobN n=1 Tax=Halodesulfurarchaeum sp. HSR-GB TaxID=3074077 RepID=UPI00285BBB70|nr:cobaltochelatase subunit CobN [Halodesulfurarchaeum sp. HSR-GB]MDR5656367.1 cobaltochelatase subunit CobN [Halodesulfurarchaeum sp. HSR-GB]